jgi:hypothetical protein
MKTGRLLKLHRPGVELHVYLYLDGPEVKAAVYALGCGAPNLDPIHAVTGSSEAAVEAEVRSWVDARFPKSAVPGNAPE